MSLKSLNVVLETTFDTRQTLSILFFFISRSPQLDTFLFQVCSALFFGVNTLLYNDIRQGLLSKDKK